MRNIRCSILSYLGVANGLVEHFRPVDSKPSSNWLRLDVFQPESPTPKVSRQGSLTSVFSSPISFGKGSRKGKDVDESYREDHLPQNLRDLKYLIISFTNIKGKASSRICPDSCWRITDCGYF